MVWAALMLKEFSLNAPWTVMNHFSIVMKRWYCSHFLKELPSTHSHRQQFDLYFHKISATIFALYNTHITPAVNAFHLPHQRYPGMPVVTVLVIVLAEFAVPRSICLHHVAVLQACRGPVLFGTLLTTVGGVTSYGVTAGQHRTRHLLTVHLPWRSL